MAAIVDEFIVEIIKFHLGPTWLGHYKEMVLLMSTP